MGDLLAGKFDRAEQNKMFDKIGDTISNFMPFATGGGFTVGGAGGTDSQFVGFRATPGERVAVIPQGKSFGGGGGSMTNITVEINAPGADAGTLARMREIVHAEIIPQVLPAAHKYTVSQMKRPRFV